MKIRNDIQSPMRAADQSRVEQDSALAEKTASHVIGVLCVDDHPLVIDGLRAQFDIDGRVEVLGRLDSASELVVQVQKLKPHAVLLDIELPGPDIFEMTDRLRRTCPDVRIIILTAHARDSFVTSAFRAGACAYFTKSDDIMEIIDGICTVVTSPAGAFLLSSTMKDKFDVPSKSAKGAHGGGTRAGSSHGVIGEENGEGEVVTPLYTLTARELEILRLIGKGLSRVQIAAQLSRSVKTVDGHQERMMKKLGVESRADLMRLAIREGLAQA